MSDIESTTTPSEVAEVSTKKTPTCVADLTLGNKKMHYFAIYAIRHLQDKNIFPNDYNPIDLPISLLETFDFKEIANMFKPLKKTKATKNVVSATPPDIVQIVVQNSETLVEDIVSAAKPTKAKKETKPKEPKEPKAKKETKPKSKKGAEPVAEPIVEQASEPIVEQVAEPIVEQVAEPIVEQVAEPIVEQASEPVVEEKPTKAKKETKPKEPKAKKETKPKEPKAKKETKKKVEEPVPIPEPEPEPTPVQVADEEEVEEEEIQCQIFTYDNKKYLLDQNNNLYDHDTQEQIGELVNGVPVLM